MKYHMRRSERQITDRSVIEEILQNGKYATLALCRNNEPYIVTLSYGYDRDSNSLYFHCAKNGLKTEFVKDNPGVCATIIQDSGYIQGECAHAYRAVIIRGKIEILSENDKEKAVGALLDHLEDEPENMRAKLQNKTEQYREMQTWRLIIEEISGKQGK
jgi:nitroimidazol reductase NimA-like FMN-containing flavoprotein (pyridoxamine 5'-phosphate oxidase superfamily)